MRPISINGTRRQRGKFGGMASTKQYFRPLFLSPSGENNRGLFWATLRNQKYNINRSLTTFELCSSHHMPQQTLNVRPILQRQGQLLLGPYRHRHSQKASTILSATYHQPHILLVNRSNMMCKAVIHGVSSSKNDTLLIVAASYPWI